MGAYREQLLRETGGRSTKELHMQNRGEEMPSGFLTTFKIRFTISLCLFGFFAWMSLTERKSIIYQLIRLKQLLNQIFCKVRFLTV